MDEGLTDLLRRTLIAKAAEIESGDERSPALQPHAITVASTSAPPARRPSWLAAAAITAVAVGATAIVAWRAGSSDDSDPRPPTGSSSPATVPSRPSGWYLPSRVPEGLVPESAFARREPPEESSPVREVFVRRYDDGLIEPRVWLSAYPDPAPASRPDAGATVHGAGADITRNGTDTFTTVDWYEDGWHVSVSARHGSAATAALAERTTVDPTGVQLDLTADGLERFDRSAVPAAPADGFRTTVVWSDPTDPDRRVELTVAPNVDRDTVDVLDARPYDVVDAGGQPAAVRAGRGRELLGGAGVPALVVTWFRDGYVLTLRGAGLEEPELVDLAAGVRPADETAFAALHRAASDRALPVPPLDHATFADGMAVSIRLVDDPATMAGARALLCAGHAQELCSWNGTTGTSISETGGTQVTDGTAQFDVRGTSTFVVWARGTGQQPTVQAIGAGPPEVETVPTDLGWFLRIAVAPGTAEVRVTHEHGGMGIAADRQGLDPPVP